MNISWMFNIIETYLILVWQTLYCTWYLNRCHFHNNSDTLSPHRMLLFICLTVAQPWVCSEEQREKIRRDNGLAAFGSEYIFWQAKSIDMQGEKCRRFYSIWNYCIKSSWFVPWSSLANLTQWHTTCKWFTDVKILDFVISSCLKSGHITCGIIKHKPFLMFI